MNRRKYLAISGGMIALAGCSGIENQVIVNVVDSNGNPIENATVKFRYNEGGFIPDYQLETQNSTNTSGSVESTVEENEYQIVVTHDEYYRKEEEISIDNTNEVTISLEPKESDFEVTEVSVTDELLQGDSLNPIISIKNVGDTKDTKIISVSPFDYENEVTLEQGEQTSLYPEFNDTPDFSFTLEVTTPDDSVNHDVSVMPIYSIGESFRIADEDLDLEVTSADQGATFGNNVADGIFQVVRMEVTNIGDESVNVGHDLFEIEEADGTRRFEPDSSLSTSLKNGISGSIWGESINPGITTTIDIIFDIPEDINPVLVIDSESDYRVTLTN